LSSNYNFNLYRLNIVDEPNLFSNENSRIRNDIQITEIIKESCKPINDSVQSTKTAKYKWSMRGFQNYTPIVSRDISMIILARSTLEADGYIVTDKGLSRASSSGSPPLAIAMTVFFDLTRHLVITEHTGELSQTAWKDYLEKIIGNTALSLGYTSTLEFEPVPAKDEIVTLFRSFDRITRLKLTLRIPNPELTRYTELLFEDLKNSSVREYTQDMRNPNGLSKSESARPFASAALADQGYKKGEVTIEGNRDDSFEKVISGRTAARGSILRLKNFVRGLNANANAKETKRVLDAIINEIDRIHPKEEPNET